MVTADEILAALEQEFTLTPGRPSRGGAPRPSCSPVDGGPATVGVIASVTRPFCGDCDRVRLTADGQVRNCLFAREESDLRTALRAGADRRRARRALGGRDARQARRPRHRRPVVPPARPADVRHRRLRPAVAPASALDRDDVAQEAPRGQEVRRATPGARRTPARSCAGRACAASGCSRAAPRRRSRWQPLAEQRRLVHAGQRSGRRWTLGSRGSEPRRESRPEYRRCRTTTGGRPAPCELRRGRRSSRRFMHGACEHGQMLVGPARRVGIGRRRQLVRVTVRSRRSSGEAVGLRRPRRWPSPPRRTAGRSRRPRSTHRSQPPPASDARRRSRPCGGPSRARSALPRGDVVVRGSRRRW